MLLASLERMTSSLKELLRPVIDDFAKLKDVNLSYGECFLPMRDDLRFLKYLSKSNNYYQQSIFLTSEIWHTSQDSSEYIAIKLLHDTI